MGLFDRFRKRIHEVADETDGDALSVDATTEEAKSLAPPQVFEDEWEEIDDEDPHLKRYPNRRMSTTTGTHGTTTNPSLRWR